MLSCLRHSKTYKVHMYVYTAVLTISFGTCGWFRVPLMSSN